MLTKIFRAFFAASQQRTQDIAYRRGYDSTAGSFLRREPDLDDEADSPPSHFDEGVRAARRDIERLRGQTRTSNPALKQGSLPAPRQRAAPPLRHATPPVTAPASTARSRETPPKQKCTADDLVQ